MITRDSTLAVERIPLARITVTEAQSRYPARVLHYVTLMLAQPTADAGVVSLKPRGDGSGYYEILDGHHRYCAAILCGRDDLLALVITEPNDRLGDSAAGACDPAQSRAACAVAHLATARRRWQAIETAAPVAARGNVRA